MVLATMPLILSLLLSLVLQIAPAAATPKAINIGYPSFNTAELDTKLDEALQMAKPKYVILMAGGNDALNDKKFLSAEQTRLHLQAMVRRSQASGATVILVTTHDPDLKRLLQRHRLEDYGASSPLDRLVIVNSIVVAVAAQISKGISVTFVMLTELRWVGFPSRIPCFASATALLTGRGVRAANSAETPLTYNPPMAATPVPAPPAQQATETADALEVHVQPICAARTSRVRTRSDVCWSISGSIAMKI